MTEARSSPRGWGAGTPRIVVDGAPELVAFLQQVFDATGQCQIGRPSLSWIGDSMLMVSDAGARASANASLYVYVAEVDTVHQRAAAAGARTIELPSDTPYGDRRAMVEDSWGNTWQIATYRG